jgi:CheY-like chemotaxis protein/HPt (histidine-containing phosphotransfer) domain-containing protein
MIPQISTRTQSVLIVDDNPTNLKLTRFLLDNEGYRVLTATDGQEALELLGTVHPDLVLMDIQLPGIDGLEVTRRLRGDPATADLTIVALSACAPDLDQTRVREAGCNGYIPKPIDTKTFPGLVRKYLDRGTGPIAPRQGAANPIRTILVAEDDGKRRAELESRLAEAGYEVSAVGDGASALEVAMRERPDLVLSDILMPRLDGFRLSEAVRTHPNLSSTRVILTTSGAARETDDALALSKGASALVPRSADAGVILRAIDEASTRPPGEVDREDQDGLEEIRKSFLLEGRQLLDPLLKADPEDWDRDQVRQAAHRMAGTGGTLGFPQISQTAFRMESVLTEENGNTRALGEIVADLDRLFSQIEHAGERSEIPERVRSAIAARKFVLVGFSRSEDRRLSQQIEEAGGFVRAQETIPDPTDPCDLVIVSIRSVDAAGDRKLGPWSAIVVGPAGRLASVERTPGIDLLVAPADGTEVLLRSFHLLTRRQDADSRATAGSGRVLVVDDDPTITALLKSTLSHRGLDCLTASKGREALNEALTMKPDAIVLDVNLPEMDGFEVLSALKNDDRTRNIPILMLTARQQESDILRGFALGVADYVVKPFSPMEVAARVERLLEK